MKSGAAMNKFEDQMATKTPFDNMDYVLRLVSKKQMIEIKL